MKYISHALAAACLLWSTGTQAQDMIDATNPQAVAAIIESLGHQTSALETDSYGDPLIGAETNGINWSIYFYDCKNGKDCGSLQFYVGYDLENGMSIKEINQWNTENRFARGYLDDENDPLFEMDVNLRGGVTRENFVDTLNMWNWMLSRTDTFTD